MVYAISIRLARSGAGLETTTGHALLEVNAASIRSLSPWVRAAERAPSAVRLVSVGIHRTHSVQVPLKVRSEAAGGPESLKCLP